MTSVVKFLSEMGLDVALLVAGLSGGLVSLGKNENLNVWQKILTVISGGLTATYITPLFVPLFSKMFGEGTKIEYGLAYVIGYMGLKSIEFLITKFKNSKENERNTSD